MIRTRNAPLILLALVLAACGRDAAGPSSQLKPEEARALALGLTGSARSFDGSGMASSNGAQAGVQALQPFSIAVKQQLPCPNGGTLATDVTTSGQFGQLPFGLVVDVTGTITPASCAYPVQGKDEVLTVTGSPNLAVTGHLAVGAVPNPGVQTFSAKGGLSWSSSDGRSGTCAIDFTSSGNWGANTRTFRGTICGNTIDFEGPIY